MIETVELRWFFPGHIPEDMVVWFEQIPSEEEIIEQPIRVDKYLWTKPQEGVGVKVREGRVEVKQRTGEPRTVQMGEQVCGVIELWEKRQVVDADLDELAEVGKWVPVEKKRRLRHFYGKGAAIAKQFLAKHRPEAVLPPDCHLEITAVRLAGAAWWTLGFEAEGTEVVVEEKLLPIVEKVFETAPPMALDVSASFGYPQWLANVIEG